MKNKEIILASKSPRRKELMQDLGIAFRIESKEIEERFDASLSKEKALENIALDKASAVFKEFPEAIVIGADTMVCYKDHIMGKPKNEKEAYDMLTMLSNHTHTVISGVAILTKEQIITFHESTQVTFYELDESMILQYIASKEPFDKAGAYGIQGKGKLLVKEIHGDYFNVVGLPIARVYRELEKILHK